jgi:hypothetical protein
MTVAKKVRIMTIRQALARRANAKRSRGPKTAEGKAIVSRNAIKFGFLARDPVAPGEDAAEWNEFCTRLIAALAPVGESEKMLADIVADCAWRLRRFGAVEAGIFVANLREDDCSWGEAFVRDCEGAGSFDTLIRHEARIERALHRNLESLQFLQSTSKERVRGQRRAAATAKLQNKLTKGLTPMDRAA